MPDRVLRVMADSPLRIGRPARFTATLSASRSENRRPGGMPTALIEISTDGAEIIVRVSGGARVDAAASLTPLVSRPPRTATRLGTPTEELRKLFAARREVDAAMDAFLATRRYHRRADDWRTIAGMAWLGEEPRAIGLVVGLDPDWVRQKLFDFIGYARVVLPPAGGAPV